MRRVQLKKKAAVKGGEQEAEAFVIKIKAAWQKSVESIIETGQLLIKAKQTLKHGEWEDMVEKDLPFSSRTAERLMQIAEHPILSNPTHVPVLPPSWGTLYGLARLPDDVLLEMIADGKLHCEITRKEVNEVHVDVHLLGSYRWVTLSDTLKQLISFSERWPKVGEMMECLEWPAPGSEDTELGVLMELEVGHGETEVYARVQA